MIAVNGLVGYALAPTAALATVPVTAYVIGSALASAPIARMMRRHGRRIGFSVGTLFGVAGVLLAALGAHFKLFWLLCLGTMVVGIYNACGQLYRFAAAEVAPPSFKERAISYVMAGGIIGGVVGPNLAKYSKDMLAVAFAGSYAVLVLFAIASLVIIQFIRFPPQTAAEKAGGGRRLGEIMRQPAFVVAALGATVGYGVMNLLMTATPLAMQMCSHPFSDAALVLEWHVIGMFAPSFFTGSLIRRFGVLQVMFAGVLLMFGCVAFALAGNDVMHFLVALFALGVGWNFMFIGGTTLLTECYRPEEKNRVQGTNDFLVFLTMATSSFSSGALVTTRGWELLNYGALPFLAIVTVAILWLGTRRRAVAAG
ncbi:MAG: MFS transporter [Burkholderiales bacterium]|nr:MFS transporter [Burkholderiales bacterium]